jgi:hypothetical protein
VTALKENLMQPLEGHVSSDTAYLVDDYPYSFALRCRIRYWLESDPKRGFRFVSQTEHPKTLRWNAPKRSTYAFVAAAMYLDDVGHVQWRCVHQYTEAGAALEFARAMRLGEPARANLRAWATTKALAAAQFASGAACITVNGVRQERSAAQRVEDLCESAVWRELAELCGAPRRS